MEEIRRHHLYPRLVELTRGEQKAEKIIADLPADERTITHALYVACHWHIRGQLDFSRTAEFEYNLSKTKRDRITSDGYYARYSATFDQCWQSVARDIAAYGLRVWRESGKIYLGYKHLPDIFISTEDIYSGKPYKKPEFNLTALQRKIVSVYGTPYQEEVIALRLLALLPQPIAEAISDCILGVMERRFILYYNPAMTYLSISAVEEEIRYTAYPTRVYPEHDAKKMVDKRAWEVVAARLIEEDRVTKERLEHEAKLRAERKALNGSSSEEELDHCVYGRDDGW